MKITRGGDSLAERRKHHHKKKKKKKKKRRDSVSQARHIAKKANARLRQLSNVQVKGKLWNLRDAIDAHYGKHLFLYIMATGYAVCYSMQSVVRVNQELADLSTRIKLQPGLCDAP